MWTRQCIILVSEQSVIHEINQSGTQYISNLCQGPTVPKHNEVFRSVIANFYLQMSPCAQQKKYHID